MTLNFPKRFVINGTEWNNNPLRFDVNCFQCSGSPSWQDIILSGNTALTLLNAKEDGLNYLKLFGGTEQRNIPKEYTQASYLSKNYNGVTDDTVYFDTGFIPQGNEVIEIDFTITQKPSVSPKFVVLFGARTGAVATSNLNYWLGINYNLQLIARFGTVNVSETIYIVTDKKYHCVIDLPNCTISIDGNTYLFTDSVVSNITKSIYLFYLNGDSGLTQDGVATISNFKIKRNGTVVYTAIPTTNVGIYDTVSRTLNTTILGTSGTITAGNAITPTPETPMDIVSNNGALKVSPNLFNKSTADANRIYGYFQNTGTQWNWAELGFSVRIPCKPNTTYIARYNGNETQAVLGFGSTDNDTIPTDQQTTVQVTQAIRQNNPTTNTPITITTGANDKWLIVAYNITEPQHSDMADNLQIEVGSTATPYMPYGIYTDGTIETVEAHSKNLYGGNYWALNIISSKASVYREIQGDTWTTDGTGRGMGKIIQVKPNTQYIFNITSSAVGASIIVTEYANRQDVTSSSLSLQSWSTTVGNKNTFTTTAQTHYIVVGVWAYPTPASGQQMTCVNPQLEEGSTATDYEPYYYGGSATAEILLSLGDYKDEQNVTSGAVTRNIGIKALDGSEQWSYYSVTQGNLFRIVMSDSVSDSKNVLGVLCNQYKVVGNRTDLTLSGTARNYDFINNNYTDLTDWKAYLAQQYANGTPIIVAYPLEEATTESVTPQPLGIQAGTNIVEITQASIDNLPLEVSYKGTI